MPRAIDNRFRIAGASLALFCLALFLTAYSAKNKQAAGIGAAIVQQLLHPFQTVSFKIYGGFASVWDSYIGLVGAAEENLTLRQRVEALENQNAHLMEVAQENERLRGLLKMGEDSKLSSVAARVIGYDASNWIQAVSIDRGSQHGIKEGMAVLGSSGVVGQVIAAAPLSAKVLLLTDHSSGIDAIIQGTRARGIVEGAGPNECVWRFVTEADEVKVGDRLVTSGADGVYPRGMLVGVVSSIDERGKGVAPMIKVEPAEDLDRMENLLVVTSLAPVVVEARKK
ncbi:MAG: rod shape-determining protein MreC [Oligoflexia bacterium]|nr:rod shape-determining protein MreC [Oligoflexia bacterium]